MKYAYWLIVVGSLFLLWALVACAPNSGVCENCGVSNQQKKARVQADCQLVALPVPGVTKYVCPGQCTVVIDERSTLEINSGCQSYP